MHREGHLGPVLTRAGAGGREDGLSLLEMMIVVLISSIVVAIAGSALVSLDNAASRNDSLVKEEQKASTVMAQMERDIRSASSISIPAGASAADQLQLAVLAADGSTSDVLWRYDPTAGTLTRETQQNGTFQPSGAVITRVTNGTGTPVFRYYNSSTTEIAATNTSGIAGCATAVAVEVDVSSGTAGVGSFQETAQVALTNQVQALTAPGTGQC